MLVGMLRLAPIGTGVWVLESSDGRRRTLYGEVPAELRDREVEVEPAPGPPPMGIGMVGEAVTVGKIRAR